MTQKDSSRSPALSRRGLLAGAGAAGAAALAVTALPLARDAAPAAQALAQAPDAGGGYQLTEHVKRYYQTARV